MFPFIETEDGFQTLIDNKSYPVEAAHTHYDELFEAVNEGDEDKFFSLYSKAAVVNTAFQGTGVVVKDGVVYFNGEGVHNVVTDKIISLSERGLNPQPMVNFLENLMKNTSARAVSELYKFLQHRKLPITEDGCFLAYKSVRSDFMDKHSGKINNAVGQVVTVHRNQVDEDMSKHCSFGLHVGALEYAGPGGWYNNSGDKVVIVKVNPADAVSVPSDHEFTKLRVCKYEVISEYTQEEELDNDYYPAPKVEDDCVEEEDICEDCGSQDGDCDCIDEEPLDDEYDDYDF